MVLQPTPQRSSAALLYDAGARDGKMANSKKSVAAGKPSRAQRVLSERERAQRRNSVRPFQLVFYVS